MHAKLRRRTSLFAALLVILLTLTGLVLVDEVGGRYVRGEVPAQFYELLPPEVLDNYRETFSIAHNSGDSLNTVRAAQASGADLIEVDVVRVRGKLRAAHQSPRRLVGFGLFQGPHLQRVWDELNPTVALKLDLKDTQSATLRQLAAFLAEHQGRELLISSGNVSVMKLLGESVPQALKLLTVDSQRDLERLLDDREALAALEGVTVEHTLLTAASVTALRGHRLLIFAYTVNDLERTNELVGLGVDGITTDNLALMELLSGQARAPDALRQRLEQLRAGETLRS